MVHNYLFIVMLSFIVIYYMMLDAVENLDIFINTWSVKEECADLGKLFVHDLVCL